VSPVTLTLFIGVLAKRTVSGSVSGSVPEEGREEDYGTTEPWTSYDLNPETSGAETWNREICEVR